MDGRHGTDSRCLRLPGRLSLHLLLHLLLRLLRSTLLQLLGLCRVCLA